MSKSPFKQGDITRAIKGALAANIMVGGVEVSTDGTVRIIAAVKEVDTDDEALAHWKKRNARKT